MDLSSAFQFQLTLHHGVFLGFTKKEGVSVTLLKRLKGLMTHMFLNLAKDRETQSEENLKTQQLSLQIFLKANRRR